MAGSPGFERHVKASDALLWRIEADPVLRSTTALVLLLDKPPDHNRLLAKLHDVTGECPHLRQRILAPPLGVSTPVWADDPYFDLDYHVRTFRAASDRTYRSQLDVAAALTMQSFDRARPLWELAVDEDLESGETVALLKVHHTLADRAGGVPLLDRIFDFERDAPEHDERLPETVVGEHYSTLGLWTEGVAHEARYRVRRAGAVGTATLRGARAPLRSVGNAAALLRSVGRLLQPSSGPLSPVMKGRSPRCRFDTFFVPLGDLETAAHRAGARFDDAFLTSLALGFDRYHEAHGASPSHLRVHVPVNVRHGGEQEDGSWFVPIRFPMPIKGRDALARMEVIHDIVDAQVHEPALEQVDAVANVLNRLPTGLATAAFGGVLKSTDLVASNLPGVRVPVYMAGAKVDAIVPFGPTAGAAVHVTLTSYRDDTAISVNSDPAAVTDPGTLTEHLKAGFDAVLKAGL